MSTIVELAAKLGLTPAAAGNPGTYATYLASLIVEFGAGGTLFLILGLRFGRGLLRWLRSWSLAPEHLFARTPGLTRVIAASVAGTRLNWPRARSCR